MSDIKKRMKYTVKAEKDLKKISQLFLKELLPTQKIFALKGEMGVGKTTFISYLAKAMGVEEQVTSPTYGYVKEYLSPKYGLIYHFDWYRIEDELEAYDIGIEEYLTGEKFVFMEWAENIENLLDENCVWINISKNKDGDRMIEVSK